MHDWRVDLFCLIFHGLIPVYLEAFLQLIEPVYYSGFRPGYYQIIIIPRCLPSFDIAFIYQGGGELGRCSEVPLQFKAAVTHYDHQRVVIHQNPL